MIRAGAILGVALAAVAACGTADNALIQNRGASKDNWWDALPRPAWNEFPKVLESQGWFEVYEIRPGVFAIHEPGQFEEVISYLVVGTEKALLFDTGLGIGDMRTVVAELTELEPIVVNSHTHYDHVGGNHQFEAVYGTGTEYTMSNAKGRKHEDVAEFIGEGWIWKRTPEGFDRDRYESKPFAIAKTIVDGEAIDLGGRKLEVVFTPGHAPDALCLLDRENRLLFTGDTFYPAALYAHLPGSDFALYRQTAQRLAELRDDVDFVLPAHNEPLVASELLVRMRDAFEAIAASEAEFVLTDGNREYSFDGFSILTPDPLR
ncbi:MAG TPA: MBL fold metallo-hydrolase [Vicinamibacteria bacterium]|nr:MBL fold metallo-hydrolase [Vicinamibacteria bacterium]